MHTNIANIFKNGLFTLVVGSSLTTARAESLLSGVNGVVPVQWSAAGLPTADISRKGTDIPQSQRVPVERTEDVAVGFVHSASANTGGALYSPFSSIAGPPASEAKEISAEIVREGRIGVEESPDFTATAIASGLAAVLIFYLVSQF